MGERMANKDKISDWDSTPANNTDVGGVAITGASSVRLGNDAIQTLMAQTADLNASDTIASASTTDLGSKAAQYLQITGTTTITAFGTVKAGIIKIVEFAGTLTLTHNGTTLILPGAANITTAAGDIIVMVSEGSGNWRCLSYQRAVTMPGVITPWVAYTPTITGFGTPSNVFAISRRVGDTIQVRGKFTAGTSTATEARFTMGYNGTDNNVTADTTKVPSIQQAGNFVISGANAAYYTMLVENGVGYLTFGKQDGSFGALNKLNGSQVIGSGVTLSFQAEIPISGW